MSLLGRILGTTLFVATLSLPGCGDENDNQGTEADRLGVGAQCSTDQDCLQPQTQNEPVQKCLQQFKGGYCGIENCTKDTDCPQASACVAHSDGKNYCFRICVDKLECNQNRLESFAANCSSNVSFVGGKTDSKACVPPSS